MARIILNVGKSGSGKSTSLRNFANNEYALINVLGKDLPFKNNKKFLVTEKICRCKNCYRSIYCKRSENNRAR